MRTARWQIHHASRWPRSRRASARWRRTSSDTTSSSARRAQEGADLVVFPELGLTGYLLQDLNAEVAMRRDDPRLLGLAQAADGLAAIVSFVEESDDHRLFIAAALLEGGARAPRPPQGLPAHLWPLR